MVVRANPPPSDPAVVAEFIAMHGKRALKQGYYRVVRCVVCGDPMQARLNPRNRRPRRTCGHKCSRVNSEGLHVLAPADQQQIVRKIKINHHTVTSHRF